MKNLEANKSVVRRYINEVINTGYTEFISDFIDENYTEVYDGKSYLLGVSGAIDHIHGVRNTYPDLYLNIDQQIAEGNWVVTSYTMKGTHTGEWMGIKPTNKVLKVTGVNLDCVINGKIVEHSGAANLLEPLLEAGAVSLVKS